MTYSHLTFDVEILFFYFLTIVSSNNNWLIQNCSRAITISVQLVYNEIRDNGSGVEGKNNRRNEKQLQIIFYVCPIFLQCSNLFVIFLIPDFAFHRNRLLSRFDGNNCCRRRRRRRRRRRCKEHNSTTEQTLLSPDISLQWNLLTKVRNVTQINLPSYFIVKFFSHGERAEQIVDVLSWKSTIVFLQLQLYSAFS